MQKRTKLIIGIGLPLILLTGGIIVTQMKTPFDIFLTQDFTGKKEREEKQIIEFEMAIAKQMKEHFPDLLEVKFKATGKHKATGFYSSTFWIIAKWTENQPEEDYFTDFFSYVNVRDIQTSVSMSLPPLIYKY